MKIIPTQNISDKEADYATLHMLRNYWKLTDSIGLTDIVSGGLRIDLSTLLFPMFKLVGKYHQEKKDVWNNFGADVSCDVTSDDSLFKFFYNTAVRLDLKGREKMAENLRSIYYFFANLDLSSSDQDTAKHPEEKKWLGLSNGAAILRYCLSSNAKLKGLALP